MANKKKSNKIYQPYVITPNRKCEFCKGQDGLEKTVYKTKREAVDTANQIEKEQHLFLRAYECPHKNGWHLTKVETHQW